MAWRMVKQPNGLLARFSDIVDNFTDLDLTETEALELCKECYDLSRQDAEEKVRAALEDWEPWTVGKQGDGLSRWRDSLKTVELIHGKEAVEEILAMIELKD